jgi:hypothetical protein
MLKKFVLDLLPILLKAAGILKLISYWFDDLERR